MDSDLAESVSALKEVFEKRGLDCSFGKADPDLVTKLKKALRVPARYRSFLLAANPTDVETQTPVERIRLIPAESLEEEQIGHSVGNDETPADPQWRKNYVVVARSALLGDPYFLDTSKLDAEGDCPVYSVMTGTETFRPELCASSFQQFLQILAISMEVATGFRDTDFDDEDESVFREAMGPKIKTIDPAALRAGHWT